MSGPLSTRLVSRRLVAEDVYDLSFALVDPPAMAFKGGQFVTLAVGTDAEGRPVRRSYSIASPSEEGAALRLVVKLAGGPASEFFTHLELGAAVHMTGPHGFFVLDEQHPGDVVMAATGTGLAPLFPMLGELARRNEPGRRVLYWGLRREADLFLTDELAALCDRAQVTLLTYLSQPSGPGWNGLVGRITQPIVDALPTWTSPTFYLVGNGAMISELKAKLIAAGVERKKQIRTEAFFD